MKQYCCYRCYAVTGLSLLQSPCWDSVTTVTMLRQAETVLLQSPWKWSVAYTVSMLMKCYYSHHWNANLTNSCYATTFLLRPPPPSFLHLSPLSPVICPRQLNCFISFFPLYDLSIHSIVYCLFFCSRLILHRMYLQVHSACYFKWTYFLFKAE